MRPFTTGNDYVNQIGLETDEGSERIKAAYGANYERLVAVKNKYDPDESFPSQPEHSADGVETVKKDPEYATISLLLPALPLNSSRPVWLVCALAAREFRASRSCHPSGRRLLSRPIPVRHPARQLYADCHP
jgi:hypothetical protein